MKTKQKFEKHYNMYIKRYKILAFIDLFVGIYEYLLKRHLFFIVYLFFFSKRFKMIMIKIQKIQNCV